MSDLPQHDQSDDTTTTTTKRTAGLAAIASSSASRADTPVAAKDMTTAVKAHRENAAAGPTGLPSKHNKGKKAAPLSEPPRKKTIAH